METKRVDKTAEEYLEKIAKACIKRKVTVAVAESVTSGFIQLLLSNAKNAQSFFQGGITAYNGAQKTRHLQIEPIYALDCNCVSQDISIEMAK
ncbi:MAG: CinA family protein [Flavipsychrobacter sp.]|nr:CinA family protein [Flavipsychrobacter sp.]